MLLKGKNKIYKDIKICQKTKFASTVVLVLVTSPQNELMQNDGDVKAYGLIDTDK